MTRSAKLGVASTLLLGSAFVPPYPNWRGPISLASIWVSALLGLLAAHQGTTVACYTRHDRRVFVIVVCLTAYFSS